MPSDPFAHLAALPEVAGGVDEARAAVDALRGHRVLRRAAGDVATESALRGARASAALEGVDVPLDVLRSKGGAGLAPADEAVVEGALRVASEVGPLQATWPRAPLQALARLHALAAAGLVDEESIGRPRADPEVARRLSSLTDLLTSSTDAPALVVAAVTHGELLSGPVFEQGNGVVARAASRLVLVTRGFDPGALVAPEVGHAELGRSAYDEALAGYVGGSETGLATWLSHCAEAVVLGARDAVAVCESIQRGG